MPRNPLSRYMSAMASISAFKRDDENFVLWKIHPGFVSILPRRSEEDIEALPVKVTALTSHGRILTRFPPVDAHPTKRIISHSSMAERYQCPACVCSALTIRLSVIVCIPNNWGTSKIQKRGLSLRTPRQGSG